jgi:hypothetical protein
MEGGDDKSDKEKRRELMSAAYSMIDNLSDDQLEEFLSAREVRKAQVMSVLAQMSTAELGELVGAKDAQGARAVDARRFKGYELNHPRTARRGSRRRARAPRP